MLIVGRVYLGADDATFASSGRFVMVVLCKSESKTPVMKLPFHRPIDSRAYRFEHRHDLTTHGHLSSHNQATLIPDRIRRSKASFAEFTQRNDVRHT